MVKVDHKKYGEFCRKALEAAGLSKEAAESTEKFLLQTDMFGIRTHGTLNILPYIRKIEAGGIVKDAKPEVVKEGPSWAVIDGHNGMGYYNADYAMKIGMEKAKQTGLSYIVIRNSSHYGACGVYSVEGAKEGFITITATNVGKTMTVPGGRGRIIGNAPFSYGVPQGDRHPSVFLDVATSNAAGMKVNRAKTAGQKVPDGWIVDENGKPTNDPNTKWALYPLGGHKGYGMAFFIEVLSSIIGGGNILDTPMWDKDAATVCPYSQFFIFIDANQLMPMPEFKGRMDYAVEEIANSPKAEGSDHIYLPGEIEWGKYDKAMAEGLELPDDIERNARELAKMFDLDFDSCVVKTEEEEHLRRAAG